MQQLDEFYLHFKETRSENQIQLTNQLARTLTTRNLKRLEQTKEHSSQRKVKTESFLYVCFSGLPPIENQFQTLGIPGQKLYIFPQGFEPECNEEQSLKKVQNAQLEQQIVLIHERLKKRTDKPLIFVYHSFGTTLVSALLRFYHNYYLQRVIGWIAIGPYTLSPLTRVGFGTFIKSCEEMTKQYMLKHADELYKQHIDIHTSLRLPLFKNKYANICQMLAFGHGMGFREMLHYTRQWPPVLKCIIYGREDNRIDQSALNHTAIYYCYKRKFEQKYDQKLKQIYLQKYGQKIDNVQERFIYNIDKAKHSIHIQKKYNPTLRNIIAEYLMKVMFIRL